MNELPPHAFAAALAALPGIGPVGLVDLLTQQDPHTAWRRVRAGEVRRPERTITRGSKPPPWAAVAQRVDVAAGWRRIQSKGIGVTYIGQPDFPDALEIDLQPPGVLFWLGDLTSLSRPCVAIVGTRRCTGYGRRAAFEFGRDLARVGVCVVSGLALGIDGAAHAGALAVADAPGRATKDASAGAPAGVAASGVDCPYPRRHVELWSRVARTGTVISETPPGQAAQAWRFPARNRIIAALSHAVLVVESAEGGGSMLTVNSAIERGIPVLTVPGPVTSAASAGTNKLLFEGAYPARNAGDVLAAIGDLRPWPPPPTMDSPTATEPGLDKATQRVLAAIDWTPTPTVTLAEQAGLPLGELSSILVRLEDQGLIAGVNGDVGCWERRR